MPELLEKMYKELKEVKIELHRLSAIIKEDFELSEATKNKLEKARREDVRKYVDHEAVLIEFS